jgi:hypothetical protein
MSFYSAKLTLPHAGFTIRACDERSGGGQAPSLIEAASLMHCIALLEITMNRSSMITSARPNILDSESKIGPLSTRSARHRICGGDRIAPASFALVVGWTEPEGRRPYLGPLLAYYDLDGRLIYDCRAGTGIDNAELERLWRRLQPLAVDKMPLDALPPRGRCFGLPLVLSRVHWVRPELVAEEAFCSVTSGRGSTLVPILIVRGFAASGAS